MGHRFWVPLQYTLRGSSSSRLSRACGDLGGGGGMISLSRAARLPGEGSSPDSSSLGPVCMCGASGLAREGAALGCAAVGGVVSEVPDPRLPVMSSSFEDIASLG